MKINVLNGPNLNLLGRREPDVYGMESFSDLEQLIFKSADELDVVVSVRQTNSESELIDWIQESFESKTPVILNPAAFTHYSYALRDACSMLTTAGIPLIEVHISNPHAREEFRQTSVISSVATGVIAGFGHSSYILALKALTQR
ncbi:MAG: type II 3-dehydroquinate dehydratase [Actinobacteria bacterium]|uniref:3-dehydroquinate dehydratase n=1 Tax=freshwater metagenome TaxID=449393 RepID=A0A6J6BK94_9ZZZZ|nr:type II 3-dehydroquinate dehydratase [Actinomycetota bacterium]MTA89429.1 type II 3-dehydroquinate dehydratase [Actinomycetota bacterium]